MNRVAASAGGEADGAGEGVRHQHKGGLTRSNCSIDVMISEKVLKAKKEKIEK